MKVEASFAAQLYDNARKIAPEPMGEEAAAQARSSSFAEAVSEAGADMLRSVRQGEQAIMGAMQGENDVQSVVEALSATELALETAVTVRNRVVEAYQELLRMPV